MVKTSLSQVTLADVAVEGETESELRAYIAVGRAVIIWSNLEQNFGNLVARLYYSHGGAALHKEPLFGLKRKIEFWNECFRKLPALAPHQRAALAFSRGLVEAKGQRDVLLHFAWDASDTVMGLKGRGTRADSKGRVQATMDLPLGAINGLAMRAIHLNLRLLPLVMALGRKR